MDKNKIKAIGLLSGGLDSLLAAKFLQKLGIEVIGVKFVTGFSASDRQRRMRDPRSLKKILKEEEQALSQNLGFEVKLIDITRSFFKQVVLHPKHGYGAGVNPCIDCKIYMFKKTRLMMKKWGAQFVFTGEVLHQRPMSQHRKALDIIARESGLEGFLLRPLSANRLPETIPEKKGWVDRTKLLSIEGRSRSEQMKLAQELGIHEYAQPAGGCYLADRSFALKTRDLMKNEKIFSETNFHLLTSGRQFRLSPKAKLIVGRDQFENHFLERHKRGQTLLMAFNTKGPSGLIIGTPDPEEMKMAVRILARYSDPVQDGPVEVLFASGGRKEIVKAEPFKPEEVIPYRIGLV